MLRLYVTAWVIVVALGIGALWNYEYRAGARLPGEEAWPAKASVAPVPGRFNLVISLHPHCPCSRATLNELEKILAHPRNAVHLQVLLFEPDHAPQGWSQSSLSEALAKFPDTTITTDPEGRQALLFGAQTSGDLALFSPAGRRLFHGGITGSRGHEGDNAGAEAVLGFLNGEQPATGVTPVYGCPIQTPQVTENVR
jgi:hypothetical protein